MVSPAPTITCKKNDCLTYPETLYYGKRVSACGAQPVYKKLLPDGESTELSPKPSQKLRNHSPDGFQFGYGGSGPAQLALALLLDATSDPGEAQEYYQSFKWDQVAHWGEEWSTLRSDILKWVQFQKDAELLNRVVKN